jgi:hypothetical protein
MWLQDLALHDSDKQLIEDKEGWLNDRIINAAQKLLKDKYVEANGLCDAVSVQFEELTCSGSGPGPLTQIMYDEIGHWFTLSTAKCDSGTALVYCSTRDMPTKKLSPEAVGLSEIAGENADSQSAEHGEETGEGKLRAFRNCLRGNSSEWTRPLQHSLRRECHASTFD